MNKLENIKVRSCDPAIAEIMNEFIEAVAVRGVNKEDIFEVGTFQKLEELYEDDKAVEDRLLEGLVVVAKQILENPMSGEWTSQQRNLAAALEEIVFLDLSTGADSFFERFNKQLTDFLRLDLAGEIPECLIGEKDRNIVNFFTFAINTLVEKFRESTISKKVAERLIADKNEYDLLIVLDSDHTIRYLTDKFKRLDFLFIEERIKKSDIVFAETDFLEDFIRSEEVSRKRFSAEVKTITGDQPYAFTIERVSSNDDFSDEIDEFILRGKEQLVEKPDFPLFEEVVSVEKRLLDVKNQAFSQSHSDREFLNLDGFNLLVHDTVKSMTDSPFSVSINNHAYYPIIGDNTNFNKVTRYVMSEIIEAQYPETTSGKIGIDLEVTDSTFQVTFHTVCQPLSLKHRSNLKSFLLYNGWVGDVISNRSGTYISITPIR